MTDALDLTDPVALAEALIACPSVTPATGAVFDALEAMLLPLGFTVMRFLDGEGENAPVENLLALKASGPGPHFAFAGHVDVVRRAKAGRATPSPRPGTATCYTGAARLT